MILLTKSQARLKLKGLPISLNSYEASEVLTNKHFRAFKMPEFERIYLPHSMEPFTNLSPLGTEEFIVDDNRGAVSPTPYLNMDGTDFYLSVKGIGSTISPFSRQPLKKAEVCSLLKDSNIKNRIMNSREMSPRYLTGELWSRGSPYGAQGLDYATIAMKASEMADITSIRGFRIAPVVKIVFFPEDLQDAITKIYWYRRFNKRMVQEIRLVPSNVRIYYHSDFKVGEDTCPVFDLFGIDSNDRAFEFQRNFIKSGIAILTLFVRSMKNNKNGTYSGLDFYDVWLDKDAVVAPDGTIYWMDNEGLEWITVWGNDRAELEHSIEEKMEYQIYRSLYELMYAYEQIERERYARFGQMTDRKLKFEYLLREALKDDEVIDLVREGSSLQLVIGNILGEESLVRKFVILDGLKSR